MRATLLFLITALVLVAYFKFPAVNDQPAIEDGQSGRSDQATNQQAIRAAESNSKSELSSLPETSVEAWLALINSASADDKFELLQQALKQHPYSALLLVQEAHYFFEQNNLISAIEQLAKAHQFADDQLAHEIDKTLLEWMNNIVIDVNQNTDWAKGERLFNHALGFFDDLQPLQLMHAKLLLLMQRLNEAQIIADELSQSISPKVPNEIHHHELYDRGQLRKLRSQLFRNPRHPTAVPLTKMGSHYLVNVGLSNQATVSLLLDTGASMTVLSERRFANIEHLLNYVFIEERTFNTAGGRITAPVYEINNLQIDQFNLANIRFAVIPFDSEAFDGLLGMNVFGQFEFSINQKDAFLLIKPR